MPPTAFLSSEPSEIHFLRNIVECCRAGGEKHDGIWQAAPVFCRIPFSADAVERLIALDAAIQRELPELHKFGRDRARRAYHSTGDTLTKPSYIARLRDFGKAGHGCQLENIGEILRREPTSGGLVFSVFNPDDIRNRFRPGYVPCLISGSFLVHDREFQINAFFRSQSVVEFGLHDLLFLRRIQQEVFAGIARTKRLRRLVLGSLNLFLGRAIVQRRIARRRITVAGSARKHVSVARERVIPVWLRIVENHLPNNSSHGAGSVDCALRFAKDSLTARFRTDSKM
jgi:hypothetical protein